MQNKRKDKEIFYKWKMHGMQYNLITKFIKSCDFHLSYKTLVSAI